jgi:hypothetical protein
VRRAAGLALLLAAAAHAQAPGPAPAPAGPASAAGCPAARDLAPRQLVGLWRAEFDGQAAGATLLLEPHPRYAASLSGEVNRNGERARIAADLEDGEFTLEESADGVRISATWLGDVVEGSCGREIRGVWEASGGTPRRSFTLRKIER